MTPARERSGSFQEFHLWWECWGDGLADCLPFLAVSAPLRIPIPVGPAFSRSPRAHAIGLAVLGLHTLARLLEQDRAGQVRRPSCPGVSFRKRRSCPREALALVSAASKKP